MMSPGTPTAERPDFIATVLVLPALCLAVTVTTLSTSAWAQNVPPVCDAGGPYFAQVDEPVQFDASASFDPDGEIVNYFWAFGDGSTGSGPLPVHAYGEGGIFTVTLRVTDNQQASSSCNAEVNVEMEIPPLPRELTLAHYMSQVATILPQFDPSMLQVPPGRDWFGDMTVERVANALGDEMPGTVLFEGPLWVAYDEPESTSTRFVKLDFSRGYLRYISQTRDFGWTFPHEAVPETQALSVLWDVVDQLDMPNEEMFDPIVNTVMGSDFDESIDQVTELQVERLITLPRMVNDYPVFGSRARMAVSNLGEPARFLVKWPQFRLAEGLEPFSRQEVVARIAERIWNTEHGAEVEVNIALGYGPTPMGYVPVARVGITDVEGVLEGGALEMIPLASFTTGVPGGQSPSLMLALRVRFSAASGFAGVDFVLPDSRDVRITVYDAAGRSVRRLVDDRYAAGPHSVEWDGRDHRSERVASGVYFVRLDAGGQELVQKMVLVR